MSELKKIYTSMGNKPEDLEVSPGYLASLCSWSSIELNNYSLGRGHGIEHLKEISDILKKYQLKGRGKEFHSAFPYMPLYRAIRNTSTKSLQKHDEFALEMRLLRMELESSTENEDRLKNMRSFLLNFSRELSLEEQRLKCGYLIA